MEDKLLEVISEAMDNKCSVYITVGEKGEFLITLRKNKFSVDNTISKEYRNRLPNVIKSMIDDLNEMYNNRIKKYS